jgi:c-di-GMP-binding flagellar brake protein YcgR
MKTPPACADDAIADPTERHGEITRAPADIHRILTMLGGRQVQIVAYLLGGKLRFQSTIHHVDSYGEFVLVRMSSDEFANAALLERPRCTFVTAEGGWHVEFSVSSPRQVVHEGEPAIRVSFPEVLVYHQRRTEPRSSPTAQIAFNCIADAGGIISFKASLVNVSAGGTGFLIYDPVISLEPGTLLRGCRIDVPALGPVVLDLEVRYSELGNLADGSKAVRSGCRFIDPPPPLLEWIKRQRG